MNLAFESRLNVSLSDLLQSLGIISRAELLNKGRRDVVIYHQGLAIVLEGSYSREDAENDAKKRIEQLSADVALAIHYPHIFPQELAEYQLKERLRKAFFPVRVIIPEDISGTLFQLLEQKRVVAKSLDIWQELDLNSLATLIREIGQFIISEESIKKAEADVSDLVQQFVAFLSSHSQSSAIAENLYGVLYRLYGFSIGKPSEIKEAVFAQATLAILLSSIYYESIRYAHKLDSLESLARATDSQRALETATHDILGINYEPIFETTKEVLRALPPMPRLLASLINLASEIASKRTLLSRDLAGKVYHRIVGDWSLRKGLATFYTEIPAAYLLLHLAEPSLCRIADFACGSGTLLVAAYSAANSHYRLSLLAQGSDQDPGEIEKEFHTGFIKSCYAFDVLEYATQITALNLALHSPETPIKGLSSIYALPLGYRKKDQSVSLGSLELARAKGKFDQIFGKVTKVGVTEKSKELLSKLLEIEPFDLVVMNPPFARATGRGGRAGGGMFGFISDAASRHEVKRAFDELREGIRKVLRAETEIPPVFRKLLQGRDFQSYMSIGQAGEGLLFLYLANMRVKEKGKICFVLPKSVLTGVSWFLARALLASRYHVEYLIVSYDSNSGYNFSESTSLSECLVVAKRVQGHQSNEVTRFISLLSKPKTSIEAIGLANEIKNDGDYVEAGSAKAFIVKATRKEMLDQLDNWGRFIFLPNLSLLKEVKDLFSGVLRVGDVQKQIPLTKLNDLITSIGLDRHQFIDAFRPTTGEVPGSLRVVHGGEEELRRKMSIYPNAHVLAKDAKGKALFQDHAGRLLVPDRIRITTAHVVSMMSDEPTLSNIFYALCLKDEHKDKLKALCIWLNTSWGILTVLASREETEGGWISLKMSQWRLLPVLNIDQLPEEKLKGLAEVYGRFRDTDLGRIPEQYGVKGQMSKSRVALDLSFLKVMGVLATENNLLSFYKEIASSLRQWLGE
ncbi:N-6 DNA methylase [Dehalococcoidia bacterium]|nr:N-6 DNA methylase [Dehalococcoidia bacterium]